MNNRRNVQAIALTDFTRLEVHDSANLVVVATSEAGDTIAVIVPVGAATKLAGSVIEHLRQRDRATEGGTSPRSPTDHRQERTQFGAFEMLIDGKRRRIHASLDELRSLRDHLSAEIAVHEKSPH